MNAADHSSDPVGLDAGALSALRDLLGGDEEFYLEVLGDVLDAVPVRLRELRAAADTDDRESAGRAAHTIKANAATVGARDLEAACREIEHAVRDGGPVEPARLRAAEEAWGAAAMALERRRAGGDA